MNTIKKNTEINAMVLSEYDERWPLYFSIISEYIFKKVKGIARIEHVGSTSIPGMIAKPVIDIDIEISNAIEFEFVKSQLIEIGYQHLGDLGIVDREMFKIIKCDDERINSIDHHLYVCSSESLELFRHLKFRDALRNCAQLAFEYISIKKEIIETIGNNREKYVDLKATGYREFFDRILKEI